MPSGDRVAKLRTMLEKSPGDAFLLYALAMELKKSDMPRLSNCCIA